MFTFQLLCRFLHRGLKGETKMKTSSSKIKAADYFSIGVVRLLRKEYGWTLKRIGEAIGCGESFVSMVGSGKRSLTLDHLAMLEKELGEPVAILLLKSADREKVDEQLRPMYDRFLSRATGKAKARKERRFEPMWASRSNGRMPAKEFVEGLSEKEQMKFARVLENISVKGTVSNHQIFKELKGEGLWEVKQGQNHLFCFKYGRSWVFTNGYKKTRENTSRRYINHAKRIMEEDKLIRQRS